MRIDMNLYTGQHRIVKILTEETKGSPSNVINRISAVTGLPVMAAAIMVGKYSSYSPELIKTINNFQAFYRYDSFLGLEPYIDLPGFPESIKAIWSSEA